MGSIRTQPSPGAKIYILALSLLTSGLLAGVYFMTATPHYSALAELAFHADSGSSRDSLSAAKQLFTNDQVLDRVIEALPAVHQVDWNAHSPSDARKVLRVNLELGPVVGEGRIKIRCRSRQAETAAAVLEKILELSQQESPAIRADDSPADSQRLAKERQQIDDAWQAKVDELAVLTREFESQFSSLTHAARESATGRGLDHALEISHHRHRAANARLVALEESIRNGWTRFPSTGPNEPLQEHRAAARPNAGAVIQMGGHNLISHELEEAREQLQTAKADRDLVQAKYEAEQAWHIHRANRLARIADVQRELDHIQSSHATMLHRQQSPMPTQAPSRNIPFAIIRQPEVPNEPATPDMVHCLCISQGIGLLLGLGVIAITQRRNLRDRIVEQFRQSLNVPVVGWIGKLSETGGMGLDAVQSWARLNPTEIVAFESLRLNVERSGESQVLAVTSGTKGDGKTTVAANLAVELAQSGQKTLLIDADLTGKGLSQLLQLFDSRGLANLLSEDAAIPESARESILPTLQPGLDVLPAGAITREGRDLWEGSRWREFLCWAERIYGQILIDLPALLPESDAEKIGAEANGVLWVIQPEHMAKSSTPAVLNRLESTNLPWSGIVANRVRATNDEIFCFLRKF